MLYFIIYFIYLFAFKTGQIMGYVTYRMCTSLFQRVCVTTERATGLISGLSNYTVKDKCKVTPKWPPLFV